MKLLNNKILMVVLILFSGYGIIASCTHKNEPVPAHAATGVIINHGSHIHRPGLTAGDSTQWKFDQVHSNVGWSTAFNGVGAPLTGRFNQFGIATITPTAMTTYSTIGQPLADTSWAFYENAPAKTHFSGYVQINTSNTGEPGRDQGCYITTMGTTKAVAGTVDLTVPNVAYIKTTSVAFDPAANDYLVTFNFTWQGKSGAPVTQSITGKLTYVTEAPVAGSTYSEFGLELQFLFNCRDFGITATDIGSTMTIQVNANFNNK
ncbi:MAG TPA: YceI family protein [Mucilaginibacter sp.]